ncbi:MAG: 1-(5-phosphoribosyl)-5-[(5-phosphoribosylamino)methylideneamino]imidazole-4-carboxamide isomerase [Spirochaetia bacterium]
MIVIPSIDLLNGECVRLVQGNYQNVSTYKKDSSVIAREYGELGFKRLHLVDLNGARGEKVKINRKKIIRIRKSFPGTIQLGGGIRSDEDVEEMIDLGIDRLILGTVFARRPELVEGWIAHYGGIFIIGIDAKDGKVHVSGWESETQLVDVDLARRAKEAGAAGIIYTNINRDGMLQGPDIDRSNHIAVQAEIPLIISGGIGSISDIENVNTNRSGNVKGVIVGRALYDGVIKPEEIIEKFPVPEQQEEL